MKARLKRVLPMTLLGVVCILVGAYAGANLAYDRIGADLPAMIKAAGCIPDR